jgi:hypothetical protein
MAWINSILAISQIPIRTVRNVGPFTITSGAGAWIGRGRSCMRDCANSHGCTPAAIRRRAWPLSIASLLNSDGEVRGFDGAKRLVGAQAPTKMAPLPLEAGKAGPHADDRCALATRHLGVAQSRPELIAPVGSEAGQIGRACVFFFHSGYTPAPTASRAVRTICSAAAMDSAVALVIAWRAHH